MNLALILAVFAQTQDPLEQQLAEAVKADQVTTTASPASAALLNPEMSVIATFTAAIRREETPPPFEAGDDPDPHGLGLQELEVTFAAAVDPYFRMRAFLAMPALDVLEVEEAYLEATSLPRGLGLKAGVLRSAFGRNNEQHLHQQDFARRPRTTELLGEDGLRGPAAQLSYLPPLPWYASIFVEALTIGDGLSAVAGLEQFFDVGPTWSALVAVSAATLARAAPEEEEGMDVEPPPREFLLGGDVYVKWKPENVTQTYAWAALQLEYLASRPKGGEWTGAGYAQLVVQVSRRFRLGARLDLIGLPSPEDDLLVGAAGSVAFLPTEFSRVRLTYMRDETENDTVILQLEGTIGAHGAHPF